MPNIIRLLLLPCSTYSTNSVTCLGCRHHCCFLDQDVCILPQTSGIIRIDSPLACLLLHAGCTLFFCATNAAYPTWRRSSLYTPVPQVLDTAPASTCPSLRSNRKPHHSFIRSQVQCTSDARMSVSSAVRAVPRTFLSCYRARAYFYGALLTFKGVAEMSLGTILCKNIGKSRYVCLRLCFVVDT